MDLEGGFADMLLWACLLSIAQAVGAVLVEKYHRSNQQEEGDPLKAIAYVLQEELGRIADAAEAKASGGGIQLIMADDDDDDGEEEEAPPRRKRTKRGPE